MMTFNNCNSKALCTSKIEDIYLPQWFSLCLIMYVMYNVVLQRYVQPAGCPVEGFVRSSLGFCCSKCILYTDNLFLFWYFWISHLWCRWSTVPLLWSAVSKVVGSGDFRSGWLHISIHGTNFLLLFSKLSKL